MGRRTLTTYSEIESDPNADVSTWSNRRILSPGRNSACARSARHHHAHVQIDRVLGPVRQERAPVFHLCHLRILVPWTLPVLVRLAFLAFAVQSHQVFVGWRFGTSQTEGHRSSRSDPPSNEALRTSRIAWESLLNAKGFCRTLVFSKAFASRNG